MHCNPLNSLTKWRIWFVGFGGIHWIGCCCCGSITLSFATNIKGAYTSGTEKSSTHVTFLVLFVLEFEKKWLGYSNYNLIKNTTSFFPKTRQTIRLFEIQIVTLKTKFQIYACVLVLFSYMIFGILMTLNNIVSFLSFLYVEPNTAIRKLGTATPYGCNDKIDGICILCSPTCRMWWIFSTPLLGVNEAIVIVIIHPYTCGSY